MLAPSVGKIVHYVSYGTPKGEYKSTCRAAIVTAVHPDNRVSLCVLNPEGMFFNQNVPYEEESPELFVGGTWHWPERV